MSEKRTSLNPLVHRTDGDGPLRRNRKRSQRGLVSENVQRASYRNFKMTLEYEGTHFCGWQFQPEFRTVQGHLQEKLARIFKKKVNCHASGRTDSGVHALKQVAHFKIHTAMKTSIIHKALNDFLDRDLSVLRVEEVPLSFHSQYHVKNKTYRYTILNRPSPSALWRDRAYFFPQKLNVNLMRRAARHLKGQHDFKAFQGAAGQAKASSTVKTIQGINVVKQNDFIHITVTADGFLHKMVRNIVGVLMAVGCDKISPDKIPQFLKNKDRKALPKTVPGHGLCLMTVRY
jgi:tRNA pseudouridine38-40 synthase